MKRRCSDCGANIKPACKSCPFTSGDINQRYVEKVCGESHNTWLNTYCYRKGKYLQGCLRAYNDKMYDEGSW